MMMNELDIRAGDSIATRPYGTAILDTRYFKK